MSIDPVWLFCPADRPERYGKAAAAADVVILDLEDAVAQADKPAARRAMVEHPLDPARTVIRVNAADSAEHALDLVALADTGYQRVMLPKCESRAQVERLAPREVVLLIETPLGVVTVVDAVTAPNAVGVMWGAEDLIAGLGGTASRRPDGSYRDVARHLRSTTLVAAKAAGRFALDGVYLDLDDLTGLAEEAADAVASGFDAKVCLHPRQVPVVRAAYRPTDGEIDRARRLLAEVPNRGGVFAFEGAMVDAPVIAHAEQIVRRAGDA